MKNRLIGRIVAMLLCGILLALSVRYRQQSYHDLGKDLYLAKQAARFDRYFEKLDPFVLQLVLCSFLMVVWFSVYEATAFGVAKLLDTTTKSDEPPAP